jgi:hypothetical protein
MTPERIRDGPSEADKNEATSLAQSISADADKTVKASVSTMNSDTWHNTRHVLMPLLQAMVIALPVSALIAWLGPFEPSPILWAVRIGAPIGAAALAWVWLSAPPPLERIPDLLRPRCAEYFERGGLCFAPTLAAEGGSCLLNLYFQNHYAGHATARIEVRPPTGWFGLGAPTLPSMSVTVECPGGAFGVASMHFAIPAAQQGTVIGFHVAATCDYPVGRGEWLCQRRGKPVGPIRSGPPGRTRAWLRLPTGVPIVGPARLEIETTILWNPDFSTGGFAVQPAQPIEKTAA